MADLFDAVVPALIVVDVQKAFDDADFWGPGNNPDCEANIEVLVRQWHARGWPLVFVRHDSATPDSPLAPGEEGNEFKEFLQQFSPDVLVAKNVNSSFLGIPDLHGWLQENSIRSVVICGITTNHCCETTARVAGNLGYDTYFVLDATHTFDRKRFDGGVVSANELACVTATNLHEEFATVINTKVLVQGLPAVV